MGVVKRAILSCHDKTGLDKLAKELVDLGVELIASGGTADYLRKQGIRATSVESFAGIREQLDGRVKTLHPKIHAGILARREKQAHKDAVGPEGLIDLVVVNFYPFQETAQRSGVTREETVEQIDIGGVALLRAAAKNAPDVAAVSHPQQYPDLREAMRQGKGTLPEAFCRQLAVSAFERTSEYDRAISAYLGAAHSTTRKAASGAKRGDAARGTPPRKFRFASRSDTKRAGLGRAQFAMPDTLSARAKRHQGLRYGENPHQQAAWYTPDEREVWGFSFIWGSP